VQAIFQKEYGPRNTTHSARFRAHVYEGLHLGSVLSDVRRRSRVDLEREVQTELRTALGLMQRMSRCGWSQASARLTEFTPHRGRSGAMGWVCISRFVQLLWSVFH
jgi:hypothetical protein